MRAYINQVKFYCKQTYDGKEALLAIVEMCATKAISGVPWPYRTSTQRKKLRAIHVDYIASNVGIAQASSGRHFFFWSRNNDSVEDAAVNIDHSLRYL